MYTIIPCKHLQPFSEITWPGKHRHTPIQLANVCLQLSSEVQFSPRRLVGTQRPSAVWWCLTGHLQRPTWQVPIVPSLRRQLKSTLQISPGPEICFEQCQNRMIESSTQIRTHSKLRSIGYWEPSGRFRCTGKHHLRNWMGYLKWRCIRNLWCSLSWDRRQLNINKIVFNNLISREV